MSETYEIYTPEGFILNVDKQSGRILFPKSKKPTGKYTQEYSKACLKLSYIKKLPTKTINPNTRSNLTGNLLYLNLKMAKYYLKDPIKEHSSLDKAEKLIINL